MGPLRTQPRKPHIGCELDELTSNRKPRSVNQEFDASKLNPKRFKWLNREAHIDAVYHMVKPQKLTRDEYDFYYQYRRTAEYHFEGTCCPEEGLQLIPYYKDEICAHSDLRQRCTYNEYDDYEYCPMHKFCASLTDEHVSLYNFIKIIINRNRELIQQSTIPWTFASNLGIEEVRKCVRSTFAGDFTWYNNTKQTQFPCVAKARKFYKTFAVMLSELAEAKPVFVDPLELGVQLEGLECASEAAQFIAEAFIQSVKQKIPTGNYKYVLTLPQHQLLVGVRKALLNGFACLPIHKTIHFSKVLSDSKLKECQMPGVNIDIPETINRPYFGLIKQTYLESWVEVNRNQEITVMTEYGLETFTADDIEYQAADSAFSEKINSMQDLDIVDLYEAERIKLSSVGGTSPPASKPKKKSWTPKTKNMGNYSWNGIEYKLPATWVKDLGGHLDGKNNQCGYLCMTHIFESYYSNSIKISITHSGIPVARWWSNLLALIGQELPSEMLDVYDMLLMAIASQLKINIYVPQLTNGVPGVALLATSANAVMQSNRSKFPITSILLANAHYVILDRLPPVHQLESNRADKFIDRLPLRIPTYCGWGEFTKLDPLCPVLSLPEIHVTVYQFIAQIWSDIDRAAINTHVQVDTQYIQLLPFANLVHNESVKIPDNIIKQDLEFLDKLKTGIFNLPYLTGLGQTGTQQNELIALARKEYTSHLAPFMKQEVKDITEDVKNWIKGDKVDKATIETEKVVTPTPPVDASKKTSRPIPDTLLIGGEEVKPENILPEEHKNIVKTCSKHKQSFDLVLMDILRHKARIQRSEQHRRVLLEIQYQATTRMFALQLFHTLCKNTVDITLTEKGTRLAFLEELPLEYLDSYEIRRKFLLQTMQLIRGVHDVEHIDPKTKKITKVKTAQLTHYTIETKKQDLEDPTRTITRSFIIPLTRIKLPPFLVQAPSLYKRKIMIVSELTSVHSRGGSLGCSLELPAMGPGPEPHYVQIPINGKLQSTQFHPQFRTTLISNDFIQFRKAESGVVYPHYSSVDSVRVSQTMLEYSWIARFIHLMQVSAIAYIPVMPQDTFISSIPPKVYGEGKPIPIDKDLKEYTWQRFNANESTPFHAVLSCFKPNIFRSTYTEPIPINNKKIEKIIAHTSDKSLKDSEPMKSTIKSLVIAESRPGLDKAASVVTRSTFGFGLLSAVTATVALVATPFAGIVAAGIAGASCIGALACCSTSAATQYAIEEYRLSRYSIKETEVTLDKTVVDNIPRWLDYSKLDQTEQLKLVAAHATVTCPFVSYDCSTNMQRSSHDSNILEGTQKFCRVHALYRLLQTKAMIDAASIAAKDTGNRTNLQNNQ